MNTQPKTQFVPVLSFGKCIALINKLVDIGVMYNPPLSEDEPDKLDTNHVLVYMAGNELNPEGFYSMNILDVASDLSRHYDQQRELRNLITDIDFDDICDPTDLWHETSDTISDLAKAFHPNDNCFSETKQHSYTIVGVDINGDTHEYCVQYNENTAIYIADSICDYENIGAFANEENTDHFITQIMIINDENKTVYDSNMKALQKPASKPKSTFNNQKV